MPPKNNLNQKKNRILIDYCVGTLKAAKRRKVEIFWPCLKLCSSIVFPSPGTSPNKRRIHVNLYEREWVLPRPCQPGWNHNYAHPKKQHPLTPTLNLHTRKHTNHCSAHCLTVGIIMNGARVPPQRDFLLYFFKRILHLLFIRWEEFLG